MARFRFGLALVGALALTLSRLWRLGEDAPEHRARPSSEILEIVDGVYGDQSTVDDVRCPDEVPMEEGLTFICTVDIDGVPLRVAVTPDQRRGRGEHPTRPRPCCVTKKIEDVVASYVSRAREARAARSRAATTTFLVRSPGKEMQLLDRRTPTARPGRRDARGEGHEGHHADPERSGRRSRTSSRRSGERPRAALVRSGSCCASTGPGTASRR